MSGIKAILLKEWRCFRGSDRGLFIFYLVLIVSWSSFLAFRQNPDPSGDSWWLVFFSVVVTANFSNTIFISERVSGTLEIVLTSGFSRNVILAGKMVFILLLSIGMGAMCMIIGAIMSSFMHSGNNALSISNMVLFASASFFNTAGAAFFSVKMSNPRFLHLANMFIITILIIINAVLNYYMNIPSYALVGALLLFGCFFSWLAVKEFNSERILRPVDL